MACLPILGGLSFIRRSWLRLPGPRRQKSQILSQHTLHFWVAQQWELLTGLWGLPGPEKAQKKVRGPLSRWKTWRHPHWRPVGRWSSEFPSNHSKPLFFCAIKGLQVTEVLSKITFVCNLHGEKSGSQGVHCVWEKKSLFVLTYHRELNMIYLCHHLQRNKKPFHDFKSCNDICCVLKHKQICNLENIKKSQARNKFVHNHLTLISL